jgi:hypothetical protein
VRGKKQSKIHNFIFKRALIDMKDKIENIHQIKTTGIGNIGWRNLFSYFGAIVFTLLVFLGINGKIQYDQGKLFSNFRNKTAVISQDTVVAVTPVKQKKKNIQVTVQSVMDSVLSDTFLVSDDTTYYTKEQTEKELSDILNSAVSTVQQEPQSDTKTNEEASKPIPQKNIQSVTDCKEVEIDAVIESENSCENKPTGKIKVDYQSIRGGESPYTISVDGGRNYYSTFSIENLAASKYQVYIKDANNCTSKLGSIHIKSIDCPNE